MKQLHADGALPHAPLRFWFNKRIHVKIIAILKDFLVHFLTPKFQRI